MANNQSVTRHLDAFTRGRIIGKLEEGRSVTSVAAEFELLTASFHDFGDNFKARRNRRQTAEKSLDTRHRRLTTVIAFYRGQKTARWWSVCTTPCTVYTFNACPSEKAFSVVPGTPELRDNEWGRVLFTYESRFSLSSDSYRILIRRERGSRNNPSNIIERDRGAMGLQFLFMDDNAPCHRTVAAEQLLESRRSAARTLPPVTIRELRLALQDEWAAMPQQLIDTLILSMGRRCETCLAVRGDHIPY
ncbi:transposable element Tc1 transposase [Trichonephila clavipes]|nr:transposable element Tc1 transposase [Trichonephila clavipes]